MDILFDSQSSGCLPQDAQVKGGNRSNEETRQSTSSCIPSPVPLCKKRRSSRYLTRQAASMMVSVRSGSPSMAYAEQAFAHARSWPSSLQHSPASLCHTLCMSHMTKNNLANSLQRSMNCAS
eukprot:2018494-Amphidinium_carterae.2